MTTCNSVPVVQCPEAQLRRLTEDHARANESGTENISSSNRPSALERNYTQFYDHERMDVIECIENSRIHKERNRWAEIEDCRVACIIFEESFAAALSLKESSIKGISWILSSAPFIGAQYAETRTKEGSDPQCYSVNTEGGRPCTLDQSSLNSLNVILKETAESCDVHALVQKTSDTLSKRQEKGRLQHYKGDLLTKPAMMRYMEKCCRYAWKLVCQTPPYAIEGNHSLRKSVFDPNIHQLSREYAPAEHTGSGYIQLVLWPGLFDGSSGRVIRKTEVLLQSPCQ
ncbi:uncharacterized protein LOC110044860 [Orbicella faveolata]|uniref:uncharacterized protein LOC110044860 n=1 Tax=Orbicella faveolata TaxID=48498 RepID=UPI0009E63CFD|nr:uncharacterized protein LOC110044860 [Orbicella faveolata]